MLLPDSSLSFGDSSWSCKLPKGVQCLHCHACIEMYAGAAQQQAQQKQQQQQQQRRPQQQRPAGKEGDEAADGDAPPPPVDDRSWLQKNWMMVLAGTMMVSALPADGVEFVGGSLRATAGSSPGSPGFLLRCQLLVVPPTQMSGFDLGGGYEWMH